MNALSHYDSSGDEAADKEPARLEERIAKEAAGAAATTAEPGADAALDKPGAAKRATPAGHESPSEGDEAPAEDAASEPEDEAEAPVVQSLRFRAIGAADTGTVSAVAVSPNGKRLVVGTSKGLLLVYHFANMSTEVSASEEWENYEGRAISLLQFDESGKKFVVGYGEPYVTVKDNENAVLWETYRGDMYVRDSANTFGHVHPINGVIWLDEVNLLTCADDTTARLFDSRTPPKGLDQRITNSCVFKTLDRNMRSINHETRVLSIALLEASLSPGAAERRVLLGGCADGSLQLWDLSSVAFKSKKPVRVIRDLGSDPIVRVTSGSGSQIFYRTPGEIVCYDIQNGKVVSRAACPAQRLFSPLLVSFKQSFVLSVNQEHELCWFSTPSLSLVLKIPLGAGAGATADKSEMSTSICVSGDGQVFVGLSSGWIRAFWIASGDQPLKGAQLIKTQVPMEVTSGVAPDIESSYSIYELPQNYRLYNDDVIKEVKPRRGRLRESKLPRRQ